MSDKAWFDALAIVAAAISAVGSLLALSAWLDARKYGTAHTRRPPVILSVAMGVVGLILAVTLTAWSPQVQRALEKDQEADLEQALDQATPTMAALHRYFPAEYLKAAAVARMNEGHTVRIHDEVARIVRDLIQARLASLDAASARNLFRMMLADAVAAHAQDPAACVDTLNNGIASPTTLLNPETAGLDPAATASMLQQLATRPAAPPEPIERAESYRIFAAVRPNLSPAAREALETVLRTKAPLNPDAATCDLLIGLARFTIEHAPQDLRPLLAVSSVPDEPSQQGSSGTYWRI